MNPRLTPDTNADDPERDVLGRLVVPVDAAGDQVVRGAVIISGSGKVHRVDTWAYSSGQVVRAEELRCKRGRWVEAKSDEIVHVAASILVSEEELIEMARPTVAEAKREVARQHWDRWQGGEARRLFSDERKERADYINGVRREQEAIRAEMDRTIIGTRTGRFSASKPNPNN